jgi:hypothetical protein
LAAARAEDRRLVLRIAVHLNLQDGRHRKRAACLCLGRIFIARVPGRIFDTAPGAPVSDPAALEALQKRAGSEIGAPQGLPSRGQYQEAPRIPGLDGAACSDGLQISFGLALLTV